MRDMQILPVFFFRYEQNKKSNKIHFMFFYLLVYCMLNIVMYNVLVLLNNFIAFTCTHGERFSEMSPVSLATSNIRQNRGFQPFSGLFIGLGYEVLYQKKQGVPAMFRAIYWARMKLQRPVVH